MTFFFFFNIQLDPPPIQQPHWEKNDKFAAVPRSFSLPSLFTHTFSSLSLSSLFLPYIEEETSPFPHSLSLTLFSANLIRLLPLPSSDPSHPFFLTPLNSSFSSSHSSHPLFSSILTALSPTLPFLTSLSLHRFCSPLLQFFSHIPSSLVQHNATIRYPLQPSPPLPPTNTNTTTVLACQEALSLRPHPSTLPMRSSAASSSCSDWSACL